MPQCFAVTLFDSLAVPPFPLHPVLQDILVGLLRLRKVAGPDAQRQPELRGRCSVVRRRCGKVPCAGSCRHQPPLRSILATRQWLSDWLGPGLHCPAARNT